MKKQNKNKNATNYSLECLENFHLKTRFQSQDITKLRVQHFVKHIPNLIIKAIKVLIQHVKIILWIRIHKDKLCYCILRVKLEFINKFHLNKLLFKFRIS